MKYDINKKPTKFAGRTLIAFSDALFDHLQNKALENITVNELCTSINYPRATFYNYFDDIYDLLNYCWSRMVNDIVINDYASMQTETRTFILFDRCYTYLSGYQEVIKKVMINNPIDGKFVDSLRKYLREQIYSIIINCRESTKLNISERLLAEHYANTIQLVLEWCFIRKDILSKEDALDALHILLGGLS